MKNNDPGNPKNISKFTRVTKNKFLEKKLTDETSVINLDLARLEIESKIIKNEVESIAWAISIQYDARNIFDKPNNKDNVNQCISITVENAIIFFKSIWYTNLKEASDSPIIKNGKMSSEFGFKFKVNKNLKRPKKANLTKTPLKKIEKLVGASTWALGSQP